MSARDQRMSRREAIRLVTGLGLLGMAGWPRTARGDVPAAASLKEKFAPHFKTGVALGGTLPADYSPAELALIRSQFAVLTPENCMKMDAVQRLEGRFDAAQPDALPSA